MRRIASRIVLVIILVGVLMLVFNVLPVRATGTIYIRADGSIDPPTAARGVSVTVGTHRVWLSRFL